MLPINLEQLKKNNISQHIKISYKHIYISINFNINNKY